MHDARFISNTYEGALRSAESLVERDNQPFEKRVQWVESELKKAHAQSDIDHKTLLQKEELVSQLEHTLHDSVRIMGAFIQTHVEHWFENYPGDETRDIMQIICDYGRSHKKSGETRYVRIPESSQLEMLSVVQEAEEETRNYRAMATCQDVMIKDQSEQMDRQLDKYEQSLKTIKERDHEVALLCQRNNELEKKLETYEKALQRSQAAHAEKDLADKENEELRQEVRQVKGFYKGQLDEKETRLAECRSMLGSAREEVLARKADVKNVISQTQAIMIPRNQTADKTRKGGYKSPKIKTKTFGRSRDKARKIGLPHSQSNVFPGFSAKSNDYSTKEVAPEMNGLRMNSTHPNRVRRASDPFSDIRPRQDSLGAVTRDGIQPKSLVDVQKQLPAAPPAILPSIPNSTLLHPKDVFSSSSSPHSSSPGLPSNSPLLHQEALPRTPNRRILSFIPEASIEDSESLRAPSVTSSEREEYRRSIHAFDMLSSSTTGGSENDSGTGSGSRTLVIGGDTARNEKAVTGAAVRKDNMMSVSQLYHGSGKKAGPRGDLGLGCMRA